MHPFPRCARFKRGVPFVMQAVLLWFELHPFAFGERQNEKHWCLSQESACDGVDSNTVLGQNSDSLTRADPGWKTCSVDIPECPHSDLGNENTANEGIECFKATVSGCDWSESLRGCPGNGTLDAELLAERNYYLLGNSVTRHYAFTLRDILEGKRDTFRDRTFERLEQGPSPEERRDQMPLLPDSDDS